MLKIRAVSAALLTLTAVTLGTVVIAQQKPVPQPPHDLKRPRGSEPGGENAGRKALIEAAQRNFKTAQEGLFLGGVPDIVEQNYRWSRRWMDAQCAAGKSKKERLPAFEAHLERMKGLEVVILELVAKNAAEVRGFPDSSTEAAKYYRFEAEVLFDEARQTASER